MNYNSTSNHSQSQSANATNVAQASNTVQHLINALSKVIKGRTDTIKLVLTALLADGHVLLEDYPGSGKTTLSKALGALIKHEQLDSQTPIANFKRIQFTPDMLPGDILGVTIFEPKTASFSFMPGPVFSHIVLADEINRTGPKVQAAFLECMAEKQVTVDNHTYQLDSLFFVIGTQNPLDIAGTYPLPLVQLDRFLMRIPMSYVDPETERSILEKHSEIVSELQNLSPVCTRSDILQAQQVVKTVVVSKSLRTAIVDIIQSTRNNQQFQFGLSTRAALMLQTAMQAWAIIDGREYCTEDDLKQILPYVLSHRISTQSDTKEAIALVQDLARPFIERLVSEQL